MAQQTQAGFQHHGLHQQPEGELWQPFENSDGQPYSRRAEGVIVMRAVMIRMRATLVSEFSWVLHILGAFLAFTGLKMWMLRRTPPDMKNNPLLAFLRRHLRVTEGLHGSAFVVTQPHPATGKPVRWVTPLFLALYMVELIDLLFAVDSVPAVFAITSDPFISYTSDIFAILGLRALYFALAAMIRRFKHL